MSKDWADAGLLDKIEAVHQDSLRNDTSDAVVVRRRLADFPFLDKGHNRFFARTRRLALDGGLLIGAVSERYASEMPP